MKIADFGYLNIKGSIKYHRTSHTLRESFLHKGLKNGRAIGYHKIGFFWTTLIPILLFYYSNYSRKSQKSLSRISSRLSPVPFSHIKTSHKNSWIDLNCLVVIIKKKRNNKCIPRNFRYSSLLYIVFHNARSMLFLILLLYFHFFPPILSAPTPSHINATQFCSRSECRNLSLSSLNSIKYIHPRTTSLTQFLFNFFFTFAQINLLPLPN